MTKQLTLKYADRVRKLGDCQICRRGKTCSRRGVVHSVSPLSLYSPVIGNLALMRLRYK